MYYFLFLFFAAAYLCWLSGSREWKGGRGGASHGRLAHTNGNEQRSSARDQQPKKHTQAVITDTLFRCFVVYIAYSDDALLYNFFELTQCLK